MNNCKKLNHRGGGRTAPRTAQGYYGHSRRKKLSKTSALVQASGRRSFGAMGAFGTTSMDSPAPATLAVSTFQPVARLHTPSGVDITQRVAELLWLSCEGYPLTPQRVRETFPGDALSPDDLAEVWRTLGQAGVDVDSAPSASVRPAAHTAAEKPLSLRTQSASVASCMQRTEAWKLPPSEAMSALTRRMEEAGQEMRELICSFGFAAHEHIARAEQLLAHPSEEGFEHLVAAEAIRGHIQYLQVLPNLVKRVWGLDQKAAEAFRKWREALGQPNGEEPRHEFQKLERRLRQLLPNFCYRTQVIREMAAVAQDIADKFRSSQRVLQQARQWSNSVCQMPLADVEHQTIETLEGFVRMHSELYLVKCTRLRAAEERFEQARRELIRGHVSLVVSIAGAYTNQGFGLPKLIRLGILGLIHAVERFANRRKWNFAAYAACWVRQSISDALATQRRRGDEPIRGGAFPSPTKRKEREY
jgi:hypothetical protein